LPEETQRYLAQIGELPAAPPPPDELPAPQSAPLIGEPSNVVSSDAQKPSDSASAPRMIEARTADGQHRRLKKTAASELFAQRWSNSSATLPLLAERPIDRVVGIGGALFVPLGRDPMRLSANITPSRLE
jgi:hypothetical protein